MQDFLFNEEIITERVLTILYTLSRPIFAGESTMKSALKKITLNIFLGLIALQIINLSINAIDFQPMASTVTLGDFNYLNSMTEYIFEIVIGNKDAFPEFEKDNTSSKTQVVKHISIKLLQTDFCICVTRPATNSYTHAAVLNEKYSYLFFKEINPPPPKI